MSVARVVGVGQYLIFAVAANATGQGGSELWIQSSWVPNPHEALVPFASHRVLIVRVPMLVRVVQFVVAHALGTSYLPERVEEWWAVFSYNTSVSSDPEFPQYLDDRCECHTRYPTV